MILIGILLLFSYDSTNIPVKFHQFLSVFNKQQLLKFENVWRERQ